SFTVYDHVEVFAQKLTTKYQSVLVFGRAKVIPATQEILLALIKKYVNMDIEKATKLIENEIMDTAIIEIEIDHLSGKISK
ncbi:MAG: pyridoxamine 5'-phosphate oxidase family protein, partial [Acholeplasmataceae bacterium]|nr:pyridoxamine 5'-phosphate oxidase family protein [Acholeplasmataceae bacterium]